MKVVKSEIMRELDRKTISEYGISGETLMDSAGLSVAEAVQHLAFVSGQDDPPVRLIAGRGNNGGDAFAAARHLKERGFDVEVWLAGEADAVSGDAFKHLSRLKPADILLIELPTKKDWEDALADYDGGGGSIIIDGILGIGIAGPARGPAAGAISYVNALSNRNLVVAIDVPSGLNADTGAAEGAVVVADMTVTMGLPKSGLVEPRAIEFVGTVEVADIGIPRELFRDIESDKELITGRDLRLLVARRSRNSHKGSFGHLLVLGGSPGYAGAVALAAMAAMRSGAGLVTALVPARVFSIVAGLTPEVMVHPATETESGSLASDCLVKWGRSLNDFDAVLIGPGMTQHEQTRILVERILNECRKPLIIDADALSICAGGNEIGKAAHCPIVLTPHPGELARLMGNQASDIQADRFKWARKAADETHAVVVLKGAGTIVAGEGHPLNINLTGNPGMAAGGMGDVLGGLIAGMAAQNIAPFDAARIGVYLHGKAADRVAWRGSQASMIAGDVIEALPLVFRELAAR